MAALLGAGALIELRQALIEAEAETEGGASPRVAPFGDVRDYGALLQRAGFALPVADAETLTLALCKPARTDARDSRAWRRQRAAGAQPEAAVARRLWSARKQIYRARHATPDGQVNASFEIVYLSGWAPDPSQQKPLKPGSAAQRLADALGTTEHSAGDKAAFRRQARHTEKRLVAELACELLVHAANACRRSPRRSGMMARPIRSSTPYSIAVVA